MDDFSTPGQPNLYGLQPSPANYIRPGKRPLSSMSPLIVEQAGQLRLVLGGSGGPRIISAVLQALVRCALGALRAGGWVGGSCVKSRAAGAGQVRCMWVGGWVGHV